MASESCRRFRRGFGFLTKTVDTASYGVLCQARAIDGKLRRLLQRLLQRVGYDK